ncbi:uncharacterized protein LOC143356712 [Halictus rubicundus]|uniref:uncharacterized protein LOC143356712 n=1 Tax=Halictus rubicundus TaxID=77578 RepID=UPI004036A0B4
MASTVGVVHQGVLNQPAAIVSGTVSPSSPRRCERFLLTHVNIGACIQAPARRHVLVTCAQCVHIVHVSMNLCVPHRDTSRAWPSKRGVTTEKHDCDARKKKTLIVVLIPDKLFDRLRLRFQRPGCTKTAIYTPGRPSAPN